MHVYPCKNPCVNMCRHCFCPFWNYSLSTFCEIMFSMKEFFSYVEMEILRCRPLPSQLTAFAACAKCHEWFANCRGRSLPSCGSAWRCKSGEDARVQCLPPYSDCYLADQAHGSRGSFCWKLEHSVRCFRCHLKKCNLQCRLQPNSAWIHQLLVLFRSNKLR